MIEIDLIINSDFLADTCICEGCQDNLKHVKGLHEAIGNLSEEEINLENNMEGELNPETGEDADKTPDKSQTKSPSKDIVPPEAVATTLSESFIMEAMTR
jgi:hypothetical protein